MGKPIIEIEGLGKSYRIGANREKYLSLRDEMAKTAHGFYRRFVSRHRHVPRDEEFWALKDVSLSVNEGQAVGIIGRNGAGKSTLLKILSKITPPTTGAITLRGRIASLLEVGTGFHPELTGRENIYLNGAILGMTRAEIKRKFDEIVAFAEVEKFLDTPVKRYSSGMYVRLAFAVAAHLDPEILIVDEVLAVGDSEFRRKCLGKMQTVSQVGRTVLFVSHDLGTVSNLCSKTIWLDSGNIQAFGDTCDVVPRYVASGKHLSGEISWADTRSAPCSEKVRLKAVRIRSNGHATADVMIDREVRIEVDYWNLQDGVVLVSNIVLRDKTGAVVLASHNTPSASVLPDFWSGKPRPRGLYRTVCVIPANFLNNDSYSIDVGLLNGRLEWQAGEKNLLTFVVHDTGEMKKEYMGSWVGVVRPKLAWATEHLNSGDLDAANRAHYAKTF
jgi:lipopolysaccharide transport system ATP-binding protein